MKKIMMLSLAAALFFAAGLQPAKAAEAITKVTYKMNTQLEKMTDSLMEEIADSTPTESETSDLEVIQPATRIATARLPQSYTHDNKYYYFLSNVCNTGSKKKDLRLTRVKYTGFGKYKTSYMTLKGFGHGLNLDCTKVGSTTWLWVDSDNGKSISCFKFKSGQTLKNHAKIRYSIPINGNGKKATGVSPAVSPDGKFLVVRFIRSGKQQFQYYSLKKGQKITPSKPYKTIRLAYPKQTAQGFDVKENKIYTVEGSRSESECEELGSTYYPICVRTYDIKKKKCIKVQQITGAQNLSHREPEGINIEKDGSIELNIASHFKDLYTCVNIYRVK